MAVIRIESIDRSKVAFDVVDYDHRYQWRVQSLVRSIEDYSKFLNDGIAWSTLGFYAESLKFASDGVYMVCDKCGAIYGLKKLSEGGLNCENHAEFGYFDFHTLAKVGERLLGYCENSHCPNHRAFGIIDVIGGIKNENGNERTSILCLSCKYKEYVAKW